MGFGGNYAHGLFGELEMGRRCRVRERCTIVKGESGAR